MKKIIFLIFLTTSVFATKIGYINIDLLLNGSKQFQKFQNDISSEFKKKDDILKSRAENIEKLLIQFKEEEDNLTTQEKQNSVAKIKKLDNALRKSVAKTKQQFEFRRNEELQKIQDNINNIIKKFAKKNKFDLIIYKDVAFVTSEVDITKKIAKKLEKK